MSQLDPLDLALHRAKASVHRLLRWADDRREPIIPARASRLLVDLPKVAEDRAPLWNREVDPREWPLELGKVENLRVAARSLDGLEFEAGQRFSFWAQVGPPLRVRGFVPGRELREGCVVPGIGGGLCLLSNALVAVATRAGFELLERHAHSRKVPGSRAAAGTDATVAWNYVDLRFRAEQPWRLEVRLDAEELIVAIRTERRRRAMSVLPLGGTERRHAEARSSWAGEAGRSCMSCDRDCAQARPPSAKALVRGRRSWLLDGVWPEYAAYLGAQAGPEDRLLQPIDGELLHLPRYAWPQSGSGARVQFPVHTAIRSLRSRSLASQGAARQRALLDDERRLAAAMAATLEPHDTELFVAQNLLPHLQRLGALGGRRVHVLMQRLPLLELQARLDEAAAMHRESPTLADFRAPTQLLDDEAIALDDAVEIITPHAALARCFPGKTTQLRWQLPKLAPLPARTRAPGPLRLWLPTSTVARKGVIELREALRGRACELWVSGRELEGPGFWAGMPTLTLHHGEPSLRSIDALVLPAWVEHQPRAALRALARGVPVIASQACGLAQIDGVREVATGDVAELRAALDALLEPELELKTRSAQPSRR